MPRQILPVSSLRGPGRRSSFIREPATSRPSRNRGALPCRSHQSFFLSCPTVFLSHSSRPCSAWVTRWPSPPADTARAYKHEFGLTASPVLDGFFRNNRSLPLGLVYKRQLTPTKALRLRLVSQFSRRDTANYQGTFPGPFFPGYKEGTYTQTVRLNAYAGYEWQHPLAHRWAWTHGLELGAGWSQSTQHFISDDNVGGLLTRTNFVLTATTWEGQARPYLALHYQLTNRLALFVESAILLTYQSRKDERDTSGAPPYGQAYTYDKSHAFTFLWRPVQLIGAAIKL